MLKNQLKKLQTFTETKLNLQTEWIAAGEVSEYDALLIKLPVEYTEEEEYISAMFFPREAHQFKNTDFLQFHYSLPFLLDNTLNSEVINFLFFLNSSLPIGCFSVQDNMIVCKHVATIEANTDFNEKIMEEIIPFFMNLTVNYGLIIAELIAGETTLTEIMSRLK